MTTIKHQPLHIFARQLFSPHIFPHSFWGFLCALKTHTHTHTLLKLFVCEVCLLTSLLVAGPSLSGEPTITDWEANQEETSWKQPTETPLWLIHTHRHLFCFPKTQTYTDGIYLHALASWLFSPVLAFKVMNVLSRQAVTFICLVFVLRKVFSLSRFWTNCLNAEE